MTATLAHRAPWLIGALALLPALALPAAAENVFALVDTGELFRSTDQGDTWDVLSALPVFDAAGLVAGTSATELYLASRSGTIYASTDGGMTWSATGALTASDVVALHIRPDGDLLALTETGTLYESADAVSFTPIASITAPDLVSLSRRPGPLYALTATGVVSRSEDDGHTWSTVGSITASDAVEIASVVENVFVITSTGDIWTSSDAGASWAAVSTLSQVHTASMVRSFSGTFYATTREGEIARSADGLSWSWVGATNQLNVVSLATDEPIVGAPESTPAPSPLLVGLPRPNPLGSGGARVQFDVEVSAGGWLALALHDVTGRRLGVQRQWVGAGTSTVSARVDNLPSGVYFAHLSLPGGESGRRFVIAR